MKNNNNTNKNNTANKAVKAVKVINMGKKPASDAAAEAMAARLASLEAALNKQMGVNEALEAALAASKVKAGVKNPAKNSLASIIKGMLVVASVHGIPLPAIQEAVEKLVDRGTGTLALLKAVIQHSGGAMHCYKSNISKTEKSFENNRDTYTFYVSLFKMILTAFGLDSDKEATAYIAGLHASAVKAAKHSVELQDYIDTL